MSCFFYSGFSYITLQYQFFGSVLILPQIEYYFYQMFYQYFYVSPPVATSQLLLFQQLHKRLMQPCARQATETTKVNPLPFVMRLIT